MDLLPDKTPIEFLFRTNGAEIFVKREDRIFFSQGTKIRKLFGIYRNLLPLIRNSRLKKLVLQGNLHSNAVLAGSLFFHWLGIPTKLIAYARDPDLVSPASILAKRFSELELYPNRRTWEDRMVEVTTKTKNSPFAGIQIREGEDAILPEYIFCREALQGLDSLWAEIDPSGFDRVVLDVGSGLTWLSGLHWNRLPISGICLGLSRDRMRDWMEARSRTISDLVPDEADWNSLVDPREKLPHSFSYGSMGSFWKGKAASLTKRFGIPIEPIYAAKTISVIEEMAVRGELQGRILYIYQGGNLQGGLTLGLEPGKQE